MNRDFGPRNLDFRAGEIGFFFEEEEEDMGPPSPHSYWYRMFLWVKKAVARS